MVSTRRVPRATSSPAATAHTRRRNHGRFITAAVSTTVSPDITEETPPPAGYRRPAPAPVRRHEPHREPSDRLDTPQRLQQRRKAADETRIEIEKLEVRLGISPTSKRYENSHHHRHSRGVEAEDSDSEEGDAPMLSFLDHERAETRGHRSADLIRDPPDSWYQQSSLSREAARLLWWGLDSKMRNTYSTAFKSYNSYCALHRLVAFPATVATISGWIGYKSRHLQPKTMESYISGLRSVHMNMGHEDLSVFHSPLLQRLIAGSHRLHGQANNSRTLGSS